MYQNGKLGPRSNVLSRVLRPHPVSERLEAYLAPSFLGGNGVKGSSELGTAPVAYMIISSALAALGELVFGACG